MCILFSTLSVSNNVCILFNTSCKLRIITVFIFELQALSDLMMHILLYNEHQEYELECKEKIYYRVLMIYVFVMYILKCVLCPNKTPGLFLFLVYEMLCHWSTLKTNLAAMI